MHALNNRLQLREPRKIDVGKKNATGRSFSANESHAIVGLRNWIFRGALKIFHLLNYLWVLHVTI